MTYSGKTPSVAQRHLFERPFIEQEQALNQKGVFGVLDLYRRENLKIIFYFNFYNRQVLTVKCACRDGRYMTVLNIRVDSVKAP